MLPLRPNRFRLCDPEEGERPRPAGGWGPARPKSC